MTTSDEKLIDERMDEILVSYSFYDLLWRILECNYNEDEDYDDMDLVVRHICSQVDYSKFSDEYCNGICDTSLLIQNSCGSLSISDVLHYWNFDYEKFRKNLLVPFCRNKKLDNLLEDGEDEEKEG